MVDVKRCGRPGHYVRGKRAVDVGEERPVEMSPVDLSSPQFPSNFGFCFATNAS
jgi:hypothetical protein